MRILFTIYLAIAGTARIDREAMQFHVSGKFVRLCSCSEKCQVLDKFEFSQDLIFRIFLSNSQLFFYSSALLIELVYCLLSNRG